MVSFGHTAMGSAVGIATYYYLGGQNPALGLFLSGAAGTVSHYFTDFIPHGHFIRPRDFKKKIFQIVIFDLAFSVLLFSGLAYLSFGADLKLLYVLFGIGGAQLPDVLDGLIYSGVLPQKGFFKLENQFHNVLHWHGSGNKALMWGVLDIWQVLAVLLSLWLILNY